MKKNHSKKNPELLKLMDTIPEDVLLANFSKNTIYRYRNGMRGYPDLGHARKFCELLNMSLDDFFAQVSPPKVSNGN